MRRTFLALVLLAVFASAEVGPTTSSTSTTSTTAPQETTSTTSAPPSTLPPVTTDPTAPPTTTMAPPGSSSASTTTSTSSTTTTSTTAPPQAGPESDGPEPTGPQVLPPGAQAIIDGVVRTPPNSTSALLAALEPLMDAGMSQDQAIQLSFGQFPVAGPAKFSDDWLQARFSGGFHYHHGSDIFAAGGLPVRAPADGVLRQSSDPLGGNAAYVTEDDGTYYYLAHVAGFVPGQVSGQKVRIGDVIAYVGNSGDAAGGPTHVHFEVHPKGGGPVDPKPYLDRWLADALANVPNVLTAILGPQTGAAAAGPTPATPAQRLITTDEGMFEAPAVPARSQLLWASSASPAGGALQLAAAEATEAAQSVDWAAERTRRAAAAGAWARSMATARAQVAPLMPAALRPMLGPEGIGP